MAAYMYSAISNRKQKPRWFFLIHLPFAHHANKSLLFVSLLIKKQTEVIHLQTDWTDQTDQTDLPIYEYYI
jgi:hypothetical protein